MPAIDWMIGLTTEGLRNGAGLEQFSVMLDKCIVFDADLKLFLDLFVCSANSCSAKEFIYDHRTFRVKGTGSNIEASKSLNYSKQHRTHVHIAS